MKRSDIMMLHTYLVRRRSDIVAVLQFLCEDNVERDGTQSMFSFNPDSLKHQHALDNLMHFLQTQLALMFPPDTYEELQRRGRNNFKTPPGK